jgi:tRNA U38,U39,U40 pseudouridine synthase TruA
MVRLVAAGLVEVGHGRITPAQFKKALAAGDRSALPVEAAPPNGLYLEQVGTMRE